MELKETVSKPLSLGTMYRYVDSRYSIGSEDYGYSTRVSVSILEYSVIKQTPGGVWIQDEWRIMKPRFVLNRGKKRFALETKELALQSFIARKRKQIIILRNQLLNAKEALWEVGVKD